MLQYEFLNKIETLTAGNIIKLRSKDPSTSSKKDFKQLFKNSTDIYFFRIVDQMATMNLQSQLEISKDSLFQDDEMVKPMDSTSASSNDDSK